MSLSTFQIGLLGLGLVTLVAVWGYNRWQSHRLSPRQPRPEAATQEPQIEPAGLADPVRACGRRDCASLAGDAGLVLMWIAAFLTALTGWEYFRKALPFLRDDT